MKVRQIIRVQNGNLEWWIDRAYHEGVWIYRSRDEAIRIQKQFASCPQDWFKPIADEYASQIEAAIAEYDAQENEDEELRYITETENAA